MYTYLLRYILNIAETNKKGELAGPLAETATKT